MTDAERDVLIEAVLSAHRERDLLSELRFHPAFYDLDPAGREQAADEAMVLRRLEMALDPDGLSTTARAVLSRIGG